MPAVIATRRPSLIVAAALLGVVGDSTAETLVGSGPIVAVVCPAELRPALADWAKARADAGFHLRWVEPRESPAQTAARIRVELASPSPRSEANDSDPPGERFVLLIGDGSRSEPRPFTEPGETIQRYGPERTIPCDEPYGDLGEQEEGPVPRDALIGVRHACVGRIPFSRRDELSRYFARVLSAEQREATFADSTLRIFAGEGGFGPWVDRVIEVAAVGSIRTLTPQGVRPQVLRAHPPTDDAHNGQSLADDATTPCWAWAYLGHGSPVELAPRLGYASSRDPLLEPLERMLSGASPRPGPDFAVLVACYTAAPDAPERSYASRLLACEAGPVAVIAATRITQPYGNTILASHLLRLAGGATYVGELLRNSKRAALAAPTGTEPDALRGIESIAMAMGYDDQTRRAELRDHARAYMLLGDPTLRRRPTPLALEAAARFESHQSPASQRAETGSHRVIVTFDAPAPGRWRVEARRRAGDAAACSAEGVAHAAGSIEVRLAGPSGASLGRPRPLREASVGFLTGGRLFAAHVPIERAIGSAADPYEAAGTVRPPR